MNCLEPTTFRKFQYTSLEGNNNKYYEVRTWDLPGGQVRFQATYGRVGGTPQYDEKIVSPDWVERKIREKTGKGYCEVELHRPQAAAPAGPVAASGSPLVDQLVRWIFEEAGTSIASYLAVPVDALSVGQIARGRQLLAYAGQLHTASASSLSGRDLRLANVVQDFYKAIPTQLPHRIDRDQVVADFVKDLAKQENRLNQLEAALSSHVAPGQSQYNALGADIQALESGDPIRAQVVQYVNQTTGHHFKPRVRDVFQVAIPDERKRFVANQRGRANVQSLFHGTRGGNVQYILKSGLMVPQTAANGRMFGDGIYLANCSTKSGQYCGNRSSAIPHFLFVADAALGTIYVAPDATPNYRQAPRGHDSVMGKAHYTRSYGGHLQYDEFIVYDNAQVSIRFLVTFDR